ncbi:dehydrogenase/reductase SDR family member 1-like [Mobula birostris]|uniref:dehydrogenase/reductase SDR family member 1-like n=1 Tax=Mobula birostris TaxID=1983395 RepID=UPI003B27DBDD
MELRRHGVSYVSLWPGAVRTETITGFIRDSPLETPSDIQFAQLVASGETPEMSGLCIVALATDKKLLKKSGRVHLTSDLASEYGLVDVDGETPSHYLAGVGLGTWVLVGEAAVSGWAADPGLLVRPGVRA